MTQRVLGPTGGTRRRRLRLLVPFAVLITLLLAIGASAGTVGTNAGFESDDGNLADGAAAGIDWNSFDPVSWTGTAPDRTATKTLSGWLFDGLEDAQGSNADDGFAGGTKQDHDCASVIGSKAPNKDDLERVYLASKNVSVGGANHTFLMLGWVRIPQNSPSPSAHIGFEFNQGETACSGGSGLVERTADDPATTGVNEADMLIIYNFEGGNVAPTITISRWVDTGSCDVSSNSPPCWGPKDTLTSGEAEAQVNHGGGGVSGAGIIDALAPPAPPAQTSVDDTLGLKEFGEAGIDLTEAGIFPANQCVTFGNAYAVSRSSGTSAQAQMKDLVGPLDFELTNCGSLKIVKKDAANANLAGAKFKVYKDDGDETFEPGTDDVQILANGAPGSFECETTADGTGNCTFSNLIINQKYWVHETAAPAGYTADATNPKLVTITNASQHTVTFVNQPALGDLKVIKKDDANNLVSGATFSLTGTSDSGASVNLTCTTGATGECTFSNVPVGTYSLDETVTPAGYTKDPTLPKNVTVVAGTLTTVNVTDPRAHRVIVIVCHEGTNTLYSSNVTLSGTTKASLAPAGLPMGVTESTVCGLGGATFGGLGHDTFTPSVVIASH